MDAAVGPTAAAAAVAESARAGVAGVEVVARAARGDACPAPPMSSTVVARPTLGERGVAAAVRAHGAEFRDVLGEGYEAEDVVEGLTLEGGVERGDDDRLARRGPTLAPLDDVGEELALVDADDVEGVDDVVHLGESARGEGGERLTVVGDDIPGGEASAPPAAAPGSLSYRVSPAYLTTRH